MSRLEDALRRTTQAEVDEALSSLGKPKVTCVETEPSLSECQAAVGGMIEAVYLPDGRLMYVNEEGLLKGLPLNEMASDIAGKYIVGDVIIIRDWSAGD